MKLLPNTLVIQPSMAARQQFGRSLSIHIDIGSHLS